MSSRPLIPLPPQEVINKNGNSFHIKVADYLSDKWWNIEISPYYTDFVTNAPREVDIIAYKIKEIPGRVNSDNIRIPAFEIRVQLFIECKYLDPNNTIVTRTQPIDENRIEKYVAKEKILANLLKDKGELPAEIKSMHHYFFYKSVAKLFGNQTNDDPIFKWINQVLHSLIYFETHPLWKASKYNYNYPLVLVNEFSNFHEKNSEEEKPKLINDNFLFATNYSYSFKKEITLNREFFIDIVDFEKWLPSFLIKIDKELERYAEKLETLPLSFSTIIMNHDNLLY